MGGQPFGYIFQPNDGATEWDFSKEKPVFDQGAYWTVLPVYTEHRQTIEALVGALKELIEASERANGDHSAPHDCYATGPLTGNPIADFIVCPGCVLKNEIESARAALLLAGEKNNE